MLARPPFWLLLYPLITTACGPWYLEQVAGTAGTVLDIQPPDELAFGAVSPAGDPVRREATIRVEGSGRVVLESLELSPDGEGAFALVRDPSPCVVAAGEPAVVEVRFLPDATGSFSGRLTFLATVGGNGVELSRRLVGSGCNDPDRDGECVASLPGWEPVAPTGDTALR